MTLAGQLNIHSYKNLHTQEIQTVPLFVHDELQADLVVVPPGGSIARHVHAHEDELFDVVEGTGAFEVGERRFAGNPGRCVFVPAGTSHALHNDADAPWVLRITFHKAVIPRHVGHILLRALRRKLRLSD